jgi:capsule biosynthesis phosphatase
MPKIVLDVDDTLTINSSSTDYAYKVPRSEVITKLIEYKAMGFEIVLFSSRNMRSFEGNLGKINAHTLPTLVSWLKLHKIPYDEIWMGKPWCGNDGFYVDDRAIRPDEFSSMTYSEIKKMLGSH